MQNDKKISDNCGLGEWINDISRSFINGKWVNGRSDRLYQIEDPFDGSIIAEISLANLEQIKDAYEVAKTAQEDWSKSTPEERRLILRSALRFIERHKSDIIQLIVRETGGTLLKAELEYAMAIFDINDSIRMVDEIFSPRDYPSQSPGKISRVYKLPLGVITSITPFNFPFNLGTRTIFPAIALGNAVVHKPDVQVGLIGGQVFAKAFEEAGLPKGVYNSILTDLQESGDEFLTNSHSDFISFTGSTPVGKHIGKIAGQSLKGVALELGGNNPLVVLADADVDQAVKIATFGKFLHSGQICAITNRIIVHGNIYGQFVSKFVERVKSLKVGDPKDIKTNVGPVVNSQQAEKIMKFVDKAKKDGLKMVLQGERNGNLISPFVFIDVPANSALASCEIFGPIAQIIPAKTDDEAIEIANSTEFGLSASIITSNLERGEQLALEVQSGMAHVNDMPALAESNAPFGGVKQSGIGRFGYQWIVEELTATKWITVQTQPIDYPF